MPSAFEDLCDRDESLLERLLAWQEARKAGRDLSVAELCPDDPAGQAKLRAWIAALHGFDAFADDGAMQASPPPSSITCSLDLDIVRFHASGGLGEVYVARDGRLGREVALKRIKAGADRPGSRTRFLLEAEVTGGLEHPGIVPVYGVGHDADGRPYYAMRFIRGESLEEAIANFHRADGRAGRDPGERALALRQLLGRFVDVCNAVAYAHSRGVLHRDLKPGNVMLGPYGETLVVDWGLAKVVGRRDGAGPSGGAVLEPTSGSGPAATRPGSSPGTPGFMSPEQAAGKLDELGPAGDVYSLGAMLYNLLTGRPPFVDTERAELLRKVSAGEFPRPRQINGTVPPALEAVCLEAMARAPGGRYPSPKALGDEIEHWLADEPVTAWREPWSIRARRWMRRHRTAMTGAAAAVLTGLIGLAAVAAEQARSNRELTKAYGRVSDALDAETKAKKEKEDALAQSEESRKQAEAVNAFLVSAFRSPDPSQDGREIKVADVLDRASDELDKEHTGSQATKGALLDALGMTYRSLGLYGRAVILHSRARSVREAALGPDHPATLGSCHNLATAYWHARRLPEAIALHEATLRRKEAVLGPEHPDTLKTRSNLALAYRSAGRLAEAIALDEATLKIDEAKQGPDHPETLRSRNNLAGAYYLAGRHAEAVALGEVTLELMDAKLGPDHPDTLRTRGNLALFLWSVGRTEKAIELHEATLELMERKLGPDHSDTLQCRGNLGLAYLSVDRVPEAVAMLEIALKLGEAKLGPDYPEMLECRSNLAGAYAQLGRMTEAIALHEVTLELRKAKLGPDHPGTLVSRVNLADCYREAGHVSEAMDLFGPTLRLMATKLGEDHPHTLWCRLALADAEAALGRWGDAEGLLRDTLARRRKAAPLDNLELAGDLARLALNLLRQSRWSEAGPLLAECLTVREKAAPDDWRRYDTMSLLGWALLRQGRFPEAESMVVGGYEGMKAREPKITVPDRSRLNEAAERVVWVYEEWGKTEQAATWKAKLGLSDLPDDVFAPP